MNAINPVRFVWFSMVVSCVLWFGAGAMAADESPWETIARYPGDVDVILVFENPGERILLGESGVATRKALATLGMFTETERAWGALAESFELESDEAIRALLGRRVVVLWDRAGAQVDNPLTLMAAADDRWVLVAEVDDAFVVRVRKTLKPVPRRICNEKPVYTIEQGRYQFAVLDATDDHAGMRMVVGPRGGKELFDRVLGSLVSTNTEETPRSDLGTRSGEMVRVVDDGWVVAGAVALEKFFSLDASEAEFKSESKSAVCAVVVHADAEAWTISVATDLAVELPKHDAPVALLGAVGGDAILAMAYANTLAIDASPSSGEMGLRIGSGPSGEADQVPGGSLVVVSQAPQDEYGEIQSAVMTLLTEAKGPRERAPETVDRVMEQVFADPETGLGPKFQGRFPGAIRTQAKERASPDSEGVMNWPGERVQASWVCRVGRDRDEMVLAFGPVGVDTAGYVRQVIEAANTLDAITDASQETGVLMRGFIRPAAMGSLMFPDQNGVTAALTATLDRVSWNFQRAPFGIRGTTKVQWMTPNALGTLGQR